MNLRYILNYKAIIKMRISLGASVIGIHNLCKSMLTLKLPGPAAGVEGSLTVTRA